MKLDDLVGSPGLADRRRQTEVVVSSRIRLAPATSPAWRFRAGPAGECVRLQESLHPVLATLPAAQPLVASMADLAAVDREFLRERHLISNELARRARQQPGAAPDEVLSVMVNEEDHLRLQAMRPACSSRTCGPRLRGSTRSWSSTSPTPSHAPRVPHGMPDQRRTGLRASVMVHIPGLRLTNEIEPIVKGLTKIGLAVRGLLGEGTDAFGNMFQISNQTTLGVGGRHHPPPLPDRERGDGARAQRPRRMMEQRPAHVLDFVGRAYGVLAHAAVLSSKEVLDRSRIAPGGRVCIVKGVDLAEINRLMLVTQPAISRRRKAGRSARKTGRVRAPHRARRGAPRDADV